MIESLTSLFFEWISVIEYVLSPSKRIYWLYLITSLVLAVYVLPRTKSHNVQHYLKAHRTKYWFNRSTLIDLKWILVNQLLAIVIFVPILGGQVSWAMSVYRQFVQWFGDGDFLTWSSHYVIALFSITLFLAEDFSRFLVHFAYHKVPCLWRFHAIHHSARVMTPLTLYRVHAVEYFINSIRAITVIGVVSGIFIYCFNGRIGVYKVLGVSIFNFLFNLAGANLRHSNIWLGFGRFEKWFISPAQHQIHHSTAKEHLDKNFGASLAIWDRIFGSWIASKNTEVKSFGLFKQSTQQKLRKQWAGISAK